MIQLSSLWQKSSSLQLEAQTIHLWSASTEELNKNKTIFFNYLNAAELTRAQKYVFEKDRERFILVRGFLRHLLGQYLNVDPKELTFEYSSHGKPEVSQNQNSLSLNFNLSDSGELALIAVGKEQNLGVDVELIRQNLNIFDMAKSVFTVNEYQRLANTPPEQQHELFFHIWTRKEATIKSIGMGLYYPLEKIDVLADTTIDESTRNKYKIFTVPISEGYKSALVTDQDIINENISYLLWNK